MSRMVVNNQNLVGDVIARVVEKHIDEMFKDITNIFGLTTGDIDPLNSLKMDDAVDDIVKVLAVYVGTNEREQTEWSFRNQEQVEEYDNMGGV